MGHTGGRAPRNRGDPAACILHLMRDDDQSVWAVAQCVHSFVYRGMRCVGLMSETRRGRTGSGLWQSVALSTLSLCSLALHSGCSRLAGVCGELVPSPVCCECRLRESVRP